MRGNPESKNGRSVLRCLLQPKVVFAAGIVLAVFASSDLLSQEGKKPYAKSEILEMLEGDVPSPQVAKLARQSGINFEMSAQTERELRDAGATDDLIQTLRKLAPKPAVTPPASPAAPVILIEVTPGGAQVYVDDEPVGTTSQEGRLKLSRFGPGEHRVRVSLQGYRDYEQAVSLEAGQTARVSTSLAAMPAATPKAPASNPEPQPPADTPPAISTKQPFGPGAGGTQTPAANGLSFPVVHDHGPPAPNYCMGVMTIGNGMVNYRSLNGMHSFEIPASAIKEARKNNVYLAAFHAFHIRLRKGTIYNFAVVNANGQYQPPDALLEAIDRAMGH